MFVPVPVTTGRVVEEGGRVEGGNDCMSRTAAVKIAAPFPALSNACVSLADWASLPTTPVDPLGGVDPLWVSPWSINSVELDASSTTISPITPPCADTEEEEEEEEEEGAEQKAKAVVGWEMRGCALGWGGGGGVRVG